MEKPAESAEEPKRRIRALHTAETITVYQAYKPQIAEVTARDGRFPATWSRERMTWIKPSFLWMMYRCGWATKKLQERVLALEITRTGFESALAGACPSHHDREVFADRAAWGRRLHSTSVRVQWDPERDLDLRPLAHRSLQLGLAGWATRAYADAWLVSVRDVTGLAHEIHALVRAGDRAAATALLPDERPYAIGDDLAGVIGATRVGATGPGGQSALGGSDGTGVSGAAGGG
ncbi:DUF4291 domain-containing protein [Yinghuangia sp. ASG 101]|uniref:DUF4291 domain-containing protein n=1 Tax=Yinghuangia sp. ASG 101 TaxID=2896848 RepID=UPI001E625D82|nr:DUF4291 domain-containing protein [Yinghuangia sp. ASG 101]UGQ08923.1 DUF4291 domain-containing protein [Yinghuangia sp. ASG 101]